MATNGSFNTTGYQGRYLTFAWSLASQSPANNTSTISWTLKGAGQAQSSWYNAGNFKVVINGAVVYSSATRIKLYNGTVVASGSYTIPHNADGSKTFTASAEAGIYTVAVNCRGNGSFTLPPISRYATIVSATNFTDIQNPSCEFNNPTGAMLQFKIEAGGNTAVVVRNNVSNASSPYTFQLTETERNALRALCPNSNTLAVRITVATYQGSTPANWSYLDRTMTIVNANPTMTGVTYKDNNQTSVAVTDNNQIIVQNQSLLMVSLSQLTALKSATLTSVAVTINSVTQSQSLSGASQSNVNISFGAVNVSSNISAQIVVTDSRGNQTTQSLPLTIQPWSLPTAIISCQRRQNYYSETDLTVDADFASIGGKNSITITYYYKLTSSSSWTTGGTMDDGDTVTMNLDNTKEWNVKVTIADRFGSTTYTMNIGVGIPIVFFDRLKKSVGFNCFPAYESSVESSGLLMDDIIYVGQQMLFDSYTANDMGYDAVLGSYGYDLISGIFNGITIPDGYVRAYKITAQISTTNSNMAKVKLNNIESNQGNTWSGLQTMRKIVSTPIFKESDITLEPTFNYTSKTGCNLYCGNTSNTGIAYFYNITVHGYLVKANSQAIAPIDDDPDTPTPAT